MYIMYTVPPPPPIGGGLVGVPMKKAVVPNVPLPMLNWLPIKNPEHTIFKVPQYFAEWPEVCCFLLPLMYATGSE